MQIFIGNDHAGVGLKNLILKYLVDKGHIINNIGTDSVVSIGYPDIAHQVASSVKSVRPSMGILICGSGQGVTITANKHRNIRASLCWDVEIAELARQHNDANILCLPARFINENAAINIVDIFLNTAFEGGRHKARVDKMEHEF